MEVISGLLAKGVLLIALMSPGASALATGADVRLSICPFCTSEFTSGKAQAVTGQWTVLLKPHEKRLKNRRQTPDLRQWITDFVKSPFVQFIVIISGIIGGIIPLFRFFRR